MKVGHRQAFIPKTRCSIEHRVFLYQRNVYFCIGGLILCSMTATYNEHRKTCVVKETNAAREVVVTFGLEPFKVTNISFTGRPKLGVGQRKTMPVKEEEERCHRQSVAWIQETIKQKWYKNFFRLPDSLTKLEAFFCKSLKGKIINLCKTQTNNIVAEYTAKVREPSNLFVGDKRHNNMSGKLALLLKRYIEAGKDKFTPPLVIDFAQPGPRNLAPEIRANFYEVVQAELDCKQLEIDSWDYLLELYFAVNYDESPDAQQLKWEANWSLTRASTGMPGTKEPSAKRESKQIAKRRKEQQIVFLSTYEHYGSYDFQCASSNPNTVAPPPSALQRSSLVAGPAKQLAGASAIPPSQPMASAAAPPSASKRNPTDEGDTPFASHAPKRSPIF